MASRRLSPPDDGLDGHQPETPPGVAGSHASKYTKEESIMKNTSFRTFTIPRANGCAPFKFAVHTLADGTVQVTRISPYDETEYHWALKSPGRNHWRIIHNGLTVSTVGAFIRGEPDEAAEPLSPEQIAYFLFQADMKAHLEPRICYN